MTDLTDYQREAAVLRRCQNLMRYFAGADESDQERVSVRVIKILEQHLHGGIYRR